MFRSSNNGTTAASAPHKHDRRALFLSRINDERMAHAMSILVDREVTVNLENGGKIKGIFNSFDPSSRGSNKAIDIALGSRSNDNARDKHNQGKPMIIHGSDYHFISAYGITKNTAENKTDTVQVPIRNQNNNKFKTDTEISSSKAIKPNPTLTEWKPTEPISDENLVELDKIEETEWDQFEANSKEYGVVTTYDENLYTTALDINEMPESVREHATALAAEIMANNGENSYAQVESLLEDEDCASTNEHVPDSTSQRHVKDPKKKEKPHQSQKFKARTAHDTGSATEKPVKSQSNRTEEPEKQEPVRAIPTSQKVKHSEKQLSHQISINALNLEPASSKVDGFSKPLIHHERKSSKGTLDDRNTEKNEFVSASKRADEKSNQANAQSSSQGSKDQSPSDANKKFKFNPNASSFTPNVNNEHTIPVSSTASRKSPEARAEAQQHTTSKTHEFKPFKPMQQYPRLNMLEHRRIDPRYLCTQGTEDKWGVSSDISYRDVLGDLSSLHLHPSVLPIRAHHIMAQNPMAAAFMLPHGTPVSYPAYIGGIPIGVLPYGPKMTPRFINGVPYGPQIIQNPVLARRAPTSSSNLHTLVPINAVTNDHIMFKARSIGHHPIDDPNHPKVFDPHQLKHVPAKKS